MVTFSFIAFTYLVLWARKQFILSYFQNSKSASTCIIKDWEVNTKGQLQSQFPPTLKNFSNGIVDPPKNSVVNNTIMSVVVMITWRVSSEKPRWSDKAYDIAPLSPETKTC